MAGRRPVIYWDTNVFVHWLAGTPPPALEESDKEGIGFWYDLVNGGAAVLVTSAITFLEVSEFKVGRDNYDKFRRLARGRGVVRAVDAPVLREASRLRDLTMRLKADGDVERIICIPDAIHLATAAIEQCDEVHTFDLHGRKQCLGLLPLNGRLDAYKPQILKPAVDAKVAKRAGIVLPTTELQAGLFDSLAAAPPEEEETSDGKQFTSEATDTGAETGDAEDRDAVGGSDSEDVADAPAAEGDTAGEGAPPPTPAEALAGGDGATKEAAPVAPPAATAPAPPPPIAAPVERRPDAQQGA